MINTKPIYALSGYAEWFWLMAKNIKPVENRNWQLKQFAPNEWKDSITKEVVLPQRIYLHASKTSASMAEKDFIWNRLSSIQQDEYINTNWESLRGKIIAEITIIEQVDKSDSIWFFGKYGLIVKDGVLYDKPIPCKGKLGFFIPQEIKL